MPTESEVVLRAASAEDLPGVADLHSHVREAAYPAMPRGIHHAEEVHRWVSGWDLTAQQVWVAEAGDRLLGYARVSGDWLEDLYVDPAAQGSGIGSMLLDLVKSLCPTGFGLWVFASNTPARTFYAARGLVDLEHTDGSGNEEREPDVKMAWPGADPVAFFRRLIDEVDAQLGDILARRAALTKATQAHKPDPRRDPDREREIAEAMARRAPGLGAERLSRIVHAIITESLEAADEG
jgi:GNAT superfamily N-acetyltransferase/chorismate mutase